MTAAVPTIAKEIHIVERTFGGALENVAIAATVAIPKGIAISAASLDNRSGSFLTVDLEDPLLRTGLLSK